MAKRQTDLSDIFFPALLIGGGIWLWYNYGTRPGAVPAPGPGGVRPVPLLTAPKPRGIPARGTKDYVAWVQRSLNQILGANLVIDGVSGPATVNAIRTFQSFMGLGVDGIVGAQTQAAISRELQSPTLVFATGE